MNEVAIALNYAEGFGCLIVIYTNFMQDFGAVVEKVSKKCVVVPLNYIENFACLIVVCANFVQNFGMVVEQVVEHTVVDAINYADDFGYLIGAQFKDRLKIKENLFSQFFY